LLIEWGTMWSGLMIFQLDESKPSDKSFAVVLTITIVVANTILLICFVVQFVRAKMAEKKEQARLDALKGEKKGSFFSDGLSALRHRFGSHTKEEGDVEMVGFENPMQEKGIKKDVKKGAKKNRSKFPEHLIVTGEQKSEMKETKHTKEAKTYKKTNTSKSIHKDAKTGRRYSHNGDTGVTKWLADEKEKSEKKEMNKTQPKTFAFKQRQRSSFMTSSAEVDLVSSVDTHVDKATGRRYSINAKTGMSEWLDKAVAGEAMHVDPTTGRRYNSKGWL